VTASTHLDEQDVARILRSYNLRLRDFLPIPRGTINSNYWVDTDGGPVFLRVNEGKTAADASFEAELIWHLGSHGMPTPQLWRTRSSEPYVLWRRDPQAPPKPVMLMAWLDGHELSAGELTADHTYVVGALLGQLHLCTAHFPRSRQGIYTMARIHDRLQRVAQDERARAVAEPLLGELTTALAALMATRRADLPTGVGHGDLFPDNLLFAHKRLPSRARAAPAHSRPLGWILDLEQAATLPYVYDIAVALLSFAPARPAPGATTPPGTVGPPTAVGPPAAIGPLDAARARALVEGYRTMRELTPAEWEALLPELTWAAVRFTTTRMTDVEGFGRPAAKKSRPAAEGSADPAQPGAVAKAKAKTRRRLPPAPPAQPKDYREFGDMLTSLRALSAGELEKALR
jgi:homoserine kinase type II